MSYEKEMEVFSYVKANAVDYLPTIIQAITEGIADENQKLREQKSKVECGLLALADKVNLSKLESNMKETLLEALKNCTFLKMDSFIQALGKGDKNE